MILEYGETAPQESSARYYFLREHFLLGGVAVEDWTVCNTTKFLLA